MAAPNNHPAVVVAPIHCIFVYVPCVGGEVVLLVVVEWEA